MRYRRSIKPLAALLAVLLLASLSIERAQRPVLAAGSDDAAAVAEAIDRLPVVGSALFTGAHPDDENSVLLPYLARGLHVRAAYLSETRGDGGQNLLGSEQYEALGLLRTEELLAARRTDGAQQFFGQGYDFGFTKSADETMQKWGHEEALGDFVRVIRTFRPDIMVSRFTGTSADGHGHHQAAGILAREAFRAAADPKRFPEQIQQGLKPWQPSKFFLNVFRGRAAGAAPVSPDTVSINLNAFDPIYGETYGEIGAEARSMHRSQGMGTARYRGAVVDSYRLHDSASGDKNVQTLFDGVDLTMNRFATLAGGSQDVASRVPGIIKSIQTAQQELSPFKPNAVLSALAQGLKLLREMRPAIEQSQAQEDSKAQALFLLTLKEADFVRAIGLAGGVRLEALADRAEIVPGESFTITVSGVVRSPDRLKPVDVGVSGPTGWKIEKLAPSGGAAAGTTGEIRYKVSVPLDAPVSQPYWLVKPRTKDYFSVPPVAWVGIPQNPPLFKGTFKYSAASDSTPVEIEQETEVVFRFADRIYGEREQPLAVVPSLGVWVEPEVSVFPLASPTTQPFLVKVRNNRSSKQQGQVHLTLPSGWRSNPPTKPFEMAGRGDEVSVRFEVSGPPSQTKDKPEEHSVAAVAEVDGQSYQTGYQVIDYPHVHTRYLFRPAVAKLERFDVKIAPGLRVGYIMGTGDSVPEALKLLGVTVDRLGADELSFGNLAKYDAIITGIRAYEVRKDLVTNHPRLMEYVRNGGVMIAQYNQYSRISGVTAPLGPYPLKQTEGPRVSMEEAAVEILEPVEPLFQSPNRITNDDFKGWVQERGLNFMDSWAPEYRPLLSSHDPGEPPQNGGMLLAPYGKGWYLYTGYVWSRQLPAGVPGAYRIFANMVSLGKTMAATTTKPAQPRK